MVTNSAVVLRFVIRNDLTGAVSANESAAVVVVVPWQVRAPDWVTAAISETPCC
jgi:hypothetical protein